MIHDLPHQVGLVREALRSEKRRLGFFLGAGCPMTELQEVLPWVANRLEFWQVRSKRKNRAEFDSPGKPAWYGCYADDDRNLGVFLEPDGIKLHFENWSPGIQYVTQEADRASMKALLLTPDPLHALMEWFVAEDRRSRGENAA
jgi:hypothetical protein